MPPSPPAAIVLDQPRAPSTSLPGLVYTPSEHGSSLASHLDPFDSHLTHHKMMRESETLSEHHMVPLSAYPLLIS
jgi:hypothetical protein